MMIWMSMSLITDLHWWGPWWWSGCLCPWSLTCIDEVPDDDLDIYDHWPTLMRSLMMIWMSMSLITDLHWWGPWWWSGCPCPWSLTCIDEVPDNDLDVYVPDHWPTLMRSLMMIWMSMSLITDLHWWGPWWWSGCLCPWSLTCIDEVPDNDLDVYVPDHWPTLMRSLMMIWMSMSLITDLHWWGPWWCSGCLCLWSLTCIDEVPDDDLNVCPWPLTCIDEVPDDVLDVYVCDHWPALMRSPMMIWMYVPNHWPAFMRSLMMIWMSMSLITDLQWWGPWWWSGCLCLWSLICIDEVSDEALDI